MCLARKSAQIVDDMPQVHPEQLDREVQPEAILRNLLTPELDVVLIDEDERWRAQARLAEKDQADGARGA